VDAAKVTDDHETDFPAGNRCLRRGLDEPRPTAGKVYRWVDENGVVHFGDAIPPEYSRQRHEVLDSRGARTTVNEEKIEPETPVRDDRDRALLATYASVEEIEAVRDRRTDFLGSQNEVAQERLADCRRASRSSATTPPQSTSWPPSSSASASTTPKSSAAIFEIARIRRPVRR
jgi:hypothetical protein